MNSQYQYVVLFMSLVLIACGSNSSHKSVTEPSVTETVTIPPGEDYTASASLNNSVYQYQVDLGKGHDILLTVTSSSFKPIIKMYEQDTLVAEGENFSTLVAEGKSLSTDYRWWTALSYITDAKATYRIVISSEEEKSFEEFDFEFMDYGVSYEDEGNIGENEPDTEGFYSQTYLLQDLSSGYGDLSVLSVEFNPRIDFYKDDVLVSKNNGDYLTDTPYWFAGIDFYLEKEVSYKIVVTSVEADKTGSYSLMYDGSHSITKE